MNIPLLFRYRLIWYATEEITCSKEKVPTYLGVNFLESLEAKEKWAVLTKTKSPEGNWATWQYLSALQAIDSFVLARAI